MAVETPQDQKVVVKEMSWDPITRIVGSLGIHTEIDFTNQQVMKCYSTSMVFRGFDIFMKGIDPRDAHFITSRICGICGDNHCTCSCLNQNMAYGVKPPKLGDYAYNLAESADFMFDHAIFNDCMANVDFCEQMVKETNPTLLKKAEETASPHGDIHGYKTIADIMRALNPFTGSFYLETLQVARYTREMYCLFGGRHTHPSTIMPGGVSAHITHQTCTDYYVRLMRYMEYVKRTVPMHDDLYDFFLQELPGYDMVGYRDTDLVCWGCFDDPDYVDYSYKNMGEWGRHRYITPGLVFKGELITTDLVEINLAMRILLGSSYFDDWSSEETFVTQDPLGNPVDKRHPWNKVTLPKPQKRDWADKYSWVVSPRMYDARNDTYVACDTGGGPFARQWVTAKAGLVDIGYLKATGHSIQMVLPKTAGMPEMELEWHVPEKSNAVERDRARTYHQAYSALVGLHCLEKALAEIRAGRTKSWSDFKVPEEAVSVGFHEAARGVLSHHMVIREGKIANYQPYPPTPWNANPRDVYGTPGPYEDAVQNTPIFEENGPENFKGVDIMRAVRSFDPCLPCGVHMYTGRRAGSRRSCTGPPACADGRRGRLRAPPGARAGAHRGARGPARRACEGGRRGPVGAIMELYGDGLRRVVAALQDAGAAGQEIHGQLVEDGVVASLLLIHDLFPIDLETRVREALATVRPYMESHGGDVEFLGIEDGVARLRLEGHCKGCPASAATLELAIKEAIEEAAPDLAGPRGRGRRRAAASRPGRRPGCCRSRCPTATRPRPPRRRRGWRSTRPARSRPASCGR